MKRFNLFFVGILWIVATAVGCASPSPSPSEESCDQQQPQPGVSPQNAESLTPQSGQGSSLKVAFNESSDKVRLVVLLSPT